LAGFAVISFLQSQNTLESTKHFAVAGALCFAFSIGLSLLFLFEASEGLRWYIVGLRYTSKEDLAPLDLSRANAVLGKRHTIIRHCRWSKAGAAIFLVVGVIFMGIATFKPLFVPASQEPHASTSTNQVQNPPASEK
jgi:hypothetical protein